MSARLSVSRRRIVATCILAALAVAALPLAVRWMAAGPTAKLAGSSPGTGHQSASPGAIPSASPPSASQGAIPAARTSDPTSAEDGWRWESYGGIEVRVPENWRYGITGSPPCLQDAGAKPYVGRPGPVRSIACQTDVAPLDKRTSYLWLDDRERTPGTRRHNGGWGSETRVVAGITLTVLTDEAGLAARILDSARKVQRSDSYGCPVDHRVRTSVGARPDGGAGGLATVGHVESVRVCRYAFDVDRPPREPILSASELTGQEARRLAETVAAAPEGSGPNAPETCSVDYAYGDEVILLVMQGERTQEVVVRYAGCDGHGTDDGAIRRHLTAELLDQLWHGLGESPHFPWTFDGSVGALIDPVAAKKRRGAGRDRRVRRPHSGMAFGPANTDDEHHRRRRAAASRGRSCP